MELEQGIRKILNLMIYEAIGALYTHTHINAICLYKLIQWDKIAGQIYKTYHGTRIMHS